MKAMKNNNIKKDKQTKSAKGSKMLKRKPLWIALASLLLAVVLFMGSLLAINAYRNSGRSIRNTVILESENFTLTMPMFAYYARAVGVGNTSEMMLLSLNEQMVLYEAALADGEKLSDQRRQLLENEMTLLEHDAEKAMVSLDEYLSVTYGRGVKVEDIRSLLEMTALANQKYESIWLEITASDASIKQYCTDNSDSFLFCDYLNPILEVPIKSNMTDAEKKALIATYEGYANDIANSKDQEEFLEKVIKYEKMALEAENPGAVLDEQAVIDFTVLTRQAYADYLDSSDPDIDKWLFSAERKAGDHRIRQSGNENSVTFGIFYVTRPLYKNDNPTYTVYDILVPFSKYVESASEANILKAKEQYEKNPTVETLEQLAKTYAGGLTENMIATTGISEELATWLGQERKAGDVMTYKGSDGWHLICYRSTGLPECEAQAKNILENEAYTALMDQYREKHLVDLHKEIYNEICEDMTTALPKQRYGWLIF